MNTSIIILAVIFMIMIFTAFISREPPNIDDCNPYLHPELADQVLPPDMVEYVKSCSQVRSAQRKHLSLYERYIKLLIDLSLSFTALLVLSPLFLVLALAIKIDDPGPVFFTQKRIGKNKCFFMLHKFRSMSMKTPHDTPTHMLQNPEQYITRIGRFLRRSSLDELPQIWDIFRGKMSIIGPRPALWNQADLMALRDQRGANDIKPGLTGLAQISGRDELSLEDKARLDGEYTSFLRSSVLYGLFIDIKCFSGTLIPVLRSDGIVEGKKYES